MIKQLFAALLALAASAVFAATDANKATQAELEAVKGIGPAMAGKILEERKKGNFKDWADLVERVKGIGEGNAAKFSAEGLTVGGAAFKGAAAPAKKDDKPTAKKEDKPAPTAKADKPAATPAAATAPAAKATDKPAAAPAAAPAAKTDKPAAAASGAKK